MVQSETLQIPQGIRFECTGCGNCCFNWPVPLTDADANRIRDLSGSTQALPSGAKPTANVLDDGLIRRLATGDLRYRGFTHTLEKRDDGRCRFLTEENRCSLHSQLGEESKPSMCRLFPYAFNETPSGAFVYVSFASTGVLYNSGRLLMDQKSLLSTRLQLYRHLYPQIKHDWSRIQLLDGCPITWDEYLLIDGQFLNTLTFDDNAGHAEQERAASVCNKNNSNDNSNAKTSALDKIIECSGLAKNALPTSTIAESSLPTSAPPHVVDQLLLKYLCYLYLPASVFAEEQFDLDAQSLMVELAYPPDVVLMPDSDGGDGTSYEHLTNCRFDRLSDSDTINAIDNLLTRFLYARVFAKMYFGPTYGHFSVIAGLHHLTLLVALVRLRLKQMFLKTGEPVTFENAAEVLRVIERRFTQTNLSSTSCFVLEVLLMSRCRIDGVASIVQ